MLTRQEFGAVTSISKTDSDSSGERCLVCICLKFAGVVTCVPIKVSLEEARELAPGDEFRIDITRTGFRR